MYAGLRATCRIDARKTMRECKLEIGKAWKAKRSRAMHASHRRSIPSEGSAANFSAKTIYVRSGLRSTRQSQIARRFLAGHVTNFFQRNLILYAELRVLPRRSVDRAYSRVPSDAFATLALYRASRAPLPASRRTERSEKGETKKKYRETVINVRSRAL